MTTTLLIPVEIKARELKARLFFAARALGRGGYRALIGPSRPLHRYLESFPRALIVENDVTFASRFFYSHARELGYPTISWDEEAISVVNDAWYVHQRIHTDCLEKVGMLFTRGQGDQSEIRRAFPELSDHVCAAGNPRLDILRPEVTPTISTNDSYILVTSRFSRSNPFSLTRNQILEQVTRKFNLDDTATQFYEGYLNHCHELFDRFLPMTRALAEHFRDRRIVLRPHPSENLDVWNQLCTTFPNCEVRLDGTAEEWSAAAAVTIHNGCTTGLEGALLGCKILAYQPVRSDTYDVSLPNQVSDCHISQGSLFASIERILAGEGGISEDRRRRAWSIADHYVGDGSGRMATDIVLDHIDTQYGQGLKRPEISHRKARAMAHLRAAKNLALSEFAKLTRVNSAKGLAAARYHDQKFGVTRASEIDGLLEGLGYSDLCARPFKLGWWSIERK